MFHVEQKQRTLNSLQTTHHGKIFLLGSPPWYNKKYHLQLNHLSPYYYYITFLFHCQQFFPFIENSMGIKIMPPCTVFGVNFPMYLVPCLKFSHVTYL